MILSHQQIEEIAAAVTKDFNEFFFGKEADEVRIARATPIDQLAKDYLGLNVSFSRLSYDGSICGLTAYADTEYIVEKNGQQPYHSTQKKSSPSGRELHQARSGTPALRQAQIYPCP